MLPIRLLPLAQSLRLSELEAIDGDVLIVADTYVESAETWKPQPWGWETNRNQRFVHNVDHHAPATRMRRAVSSGNLAIEFAI